MKDKIFKAIKCVLFILPFIFVASVVLYTILNKNAFESYGDLNNTLDNSFVYAITQFNSIGFGKINFLEWFNDMFLIDNFDNVYSIFINSYLNYFLFVELVMFIPSVFHWVIHFFTELGNIVLSKTTDKKKGD